MSAFVHLRDVGVLIWFVFHISNFYKLDLHSETCVALANLDTMKHLQKLDFPWYSYG